MDAIIRPASQPAGNARIGRPERVFVRARLRLSHAAAYPVANAMGSLTFRLRKASPSQPRAYLMRSDNMPTWKIAAVQMDCAFADKAKNLETIRARLREAAGTALALSSSSFRNAP